MVDLEKKVLFEQEKTLINLFFCKNCKWLAITDNWCPMASNYKKKTDEACEYFKCCYSPSLTYDQTPSSDFTIEQTISCLNCEKILLKSESHTGGKIIAN